MPGLAWCDGLGSVLVVLLGSGDQARCAVAGVFGAGASGVVAGELVPGVPFLGVQGGALSVTLGV